MNCLRWRWSLNHTIYLQASLFPRQDQNSIFAILHTIMKCTAWFPKLQTARTHVWDHLSGGSEFLQNVGTHLPDYMVSWPTGPQYECELIDKDLATLCFQKKSTKKTCIYASLVKLSESFDKNKLTKLYIDMYAYTSVAEIVKHFKISVMHFSTKVSLCTSV